MSECRHGHEGACTACGREEFVQGMEDEIESLTRRLAEATQRAERAMADLEAYWLTTAKAISERYAARDRVAELEAHQKRLAYVRDELAAERDQLRAQLAKRDEGEPQKLLRDALFLVDESQVTYGSSALARASEIIRRVLSGAGEEK